MFNGFKNTFNSQKTNFMNSFNTQRSNTFNFFSKKGMKMNQLHFYTGSGQNTPSGMKVCIFGATSSIGTQMASLFTPRGCPTIMVHRNALDIISPTGDDMLYNKSNPYSSYSLGYMQYDLQNDVNINNLS